MSDSLLEEAVGTAYADQSSEVYGRLFEVLGGKELYFRTVSQNGASLAVLTGVEDSRKAVVFFTDKDDPGLGRTFAGIVWGQALRMIMRMPEVDGMVVRNRGGEWIAIDKHAIEALLE